MAEQNDNTMANGFQLPFERPILKLQHQISELESSQVQAGRDYSAEIRQLRTQWVSLLRKTYSTLSPWETVQVARHPNRPLARDYIGMIVKNWMELHGDRRFGDDRAVVTGFGRIGTEKVVIIAQQKGRDTKEKLECNFGMAHPEGYRKALRVMKLAEKFHLPVVSLMDCTGAYPGVGSEERGVAEAIARNMLEMSRLKTPIVCTVISEGGSGGALGIGVGDHVAMLEYAYYSVITPEGCASILWRTGEKAPEAAEALKLTSKSLLEFGVVDDIIPEPLGGAHRNPSETAQNLERYIVRMVRQLSRTPIDELLQQRYERWRKMGRVTNRQPQAASDEYVSAPQSTRRTDG